MMRRLSLCFVLLLLLGWASAEIPDEKMLQVVQIRDYPEDMNIWGMEHLCIVTEYIDKNGTIVWSNAKCYCTERINDNKFKKEDEEIRKETSKEKSTEK